MRLSTPSLSEAICSRRLLNTQGLCKAEICFSLSKEPVLVLGPTQRHLHDVIARATHRGIVCRVRDTGGTAVLDGPWMLTTKVIVPAEAARGVLARESLALAFGAMHVAALQSMNIDARLANETIGAAPQLDWSCFAGISRNEVITGAQEKVVGVSFRHGLASSNLISGTLISPVDWALLCDLFDRPNTDITQLENRVSIASCAADTMIGNLTQQFHIHFGE